MFGYACDRCREKHQSCNHELPCKRCTKANAADSCHYTPKRTRSKAVRPSSSMSMMSSGSSNSNSPIRGQVGMPFHAFMQGHPMQPMHFDPSIGGGMIPYSSRSPPPHMMMQSQQAPSHFAHPQAPQSLFHPGSPFIYTDANGNGNSSRFLPPPMSPHGHHFYSGHPHMQSPSHHSMAGPQYHPYHASPPQHSSSLMQPPLSSSSASSQMIMSPSPYSFVPPGRRISGQNRSSAGKQQGGRRVSRSALGEALSSSTESNSGSEAHMSHHYPQHIQSSNHHSALSHSMQPQPSPLPYPELLDGIHYAASQHYHPGHHSSVPEEEAHGYHSMDGSALMASGVLVQEYIRDALAMIHDEGASSHSAVTQHHVLGVGNDGMEEMKHHHSSVAPLLERNGSAAASRSE